MEETRIVLHKAGEISPVSARQYVAIGGYEGLRKALQEPDGIVDTIKASGLRGRGGAGFPTGLKLSFTEGTSADQKYIVCNADEGEPGTNKDRVILEEIPHRLIEGMAIAGLAVGADQGYIYLRAEYPYVKKILAQAIKKAREAGFIGNDIMGSGFDFDVQIFVGAGAYVCGEETALLDSLEGKRGEPRFKPPFPGVSGLWGKPTIVNNVETLTNLPAIMVNGPEWFRQLGTDNFPGTKVFTLSGNVANPGVYEFPVGITIRQLFEEVGGGCSNGRSLYAIQTGGASGNIIPASLLDTPMDVDACDKVGATFGAGDLMFMDDNCCLLDILENLTDFFVKESCGKCTPCREGNPQLLRLVQRFKHGIARPGDLELMLKLSEVMTEGSLCGLGQMAPNPIVSTVRFFPHLFGTENLPAREVS